MTVEIKKVNITRSIFNQMLSVGSLPSADDYEVLGFVITPGKRSKVIVKIGELYRKADHLQSITVTSETLQMIDGPGYKWEARTKVHVKTFDGYGFTLSHDADEELNLKLLKKAETFVKRIQEAGQIYI